VEWDASKGLIFKAFMCFRCTFKAFGVILWHFKVVQMNPGSHFNKKNLFQGRELSFPLALS
jgi:hypothetical protein